MTLLFYNLFSECDIPLIIVGESYLPGCPSELGNPGVYTMPILGYIVMVGTAGAGKSALTEAFGGFLENQGYSVARVNLDPAADWIPYVADVDVREYVSARKVMEEFKLGPNGALVASVDMLAGHIKRLREDLGSLEADYILIDTPGQMELFAYRSTGPFVLSALTEDSPSAAVFLIDRIFVERPSGLVSALLLAASVEIGLGVPQVNVVSKADLLEKEFVEKVLPGLGEPEELLSLLYHAGSPSPLVERLAETLAETGYAGGLVPVSAHTWYGLEKLFYEVSKVLQGGEHYGVSSLDSGEG